MDSERWRALRKVLDEALELEPDARAGFVSKACDGDEDLRREVESMLGAYEQGGDLLQEPVMRLGGEEEGPPTHAGPYRLSELIGEGGMGKVYLGHRDDDTYQKQVAIKVLRPGSASDQSLRRFRSERQILASLEHAYIAKLLDGGTTDQGQPYLVMEYVEGRPIDVYCHQRDLAIEQRLDLLIKVCEAIHYAHRNLIVHRDLKPGNILVTEDGTPKLLDFGIAKILRPETFPQTVVPTRPGLLPMTPEYASPEQVRGEAVTTATDVYALGALLYELLSGHRPYEIDGSSLESIVETICHQPPARPSTAVLKTTSDGAPSVEEAHRRSRRLSGDLDAIVLRALRKEPGERYASAAQLAEDLERHLRGHPVEARRGTFSYVTSRFIRRHRLAVGSLASVFLLLVGFVVVLLVQQQRILEQRDRVLLERNRAEEVSGWWFELFKLPAPSRAKGEQVTARELLDKGAMSIGDLSDLDLKSELLATMGHTYVQLGLLREGVQLLDQSVELTRQRGPELTPVLAERLQRLSEALTLQGNFQRAEDISREVLAIHRQENDRGATLALALAQVGHLRDILEDQKEAETWLREALDVARGNDDALALAKVLEYSGDQRMSQGDLDGAESMYSESLTLLRTAHGDLHPDVALMTSNLARTAQGKRAEQLFEEAIATQRQLFEDPHPVLATALNNLGLFLFENQRFDEAREQLQEAVSLQRQLYGEEHPKFAVMLGNLANVERSLGDFHRAEVLNRRAIEVFEDSVGEDHADYALCLSNLADLLIRKQELEEAAVLVDRAYEVTANTLGTAHPRIATILNTRGQIEALHQELTMAEQTFREALSIAEASLGDQHPDLPTALFNLSVVLRRREKPAESVDAIGRALSLIEPPGTRTVRRLQWLTLRARLQIQIEDYEAAEYGVREAFEGWREIQGDDALWTLSAQRLLGIALMRQLELDEAETLLEDLVARLETTRPDDSTRLEQAQSALEELRSL